MRNLLQKLMYKQLPASCCSPACVSFQSSCPNSCSDSCMCRKRPVAMYCPNYCRNSCCVYYQKSLSRGLTRQLSEQLLGWVQIPVSIQQLVPCKNVLIKLVCKHLASNPPPELKRQHHSPLLTHTLILFWISTTQMPPSSPSWCPVLATAAFSTCTA